MRLVWAGPQSTVGLRVPSARRTTGREQFPITDVPGFTGYEVELTIALELVLVDDLFAGGYVIRELAVKDRGAFTEGEMVKRGPGLTPERLRALSFERFAYDAVAAGCPVTMDPESGVVTDHPTAIYTMSDLQLTTLWWLQAKLAGVDTNKSVAEHMGITPAAAAQRIARMRKTAQLPPAERRGQRR